MPNIWTQTTNDTCDKQNYAFTYNFANLLVKQESASATASKYYIVCTVIEIDQVV